MELILAAVVVAILIGVAIMKTKMSLKSRLVMSVCLGIPLIIWAWLEKESLICWKIIITVVVAGTLIKYLLDLKRIPDQEKKN